MANDNLPHGEQNWRPAPDVPRAHSIQYAHCDDDSCGVHIVAYDADGKQMIEIVQNVTQSKRLMLYIEGMLFEKAVRRGEA